MSGNAAQSHLSTSVASLEKDRLEQWLAANVQGFSGPLSIEKFQGGQSNPTFKLTTPGASYVLRRKPGGQLVKGAHAVEREARVMGALGLAGFPVPHVFGLCADADVIGSPFYVMEMVEGRIFWDASVPEADHRTRRGLYDAMNETLARLHKIDHASIGLADYGRPGDYCARQIARWSRQYHEDAEAGRHPDMDWLVEWLPHHIPQDGEEGATGIVHGDFRIDNMIFHPEEPRVIAVLDWELSTIGDTRVDFANHAMMYRMPPHIVAGLGGCDPAALGLPDEGEYLAAYCARTGREGLPGYDFYIAFNFFRLAAIFHGIKGRLLRGTASSSRAQERVRVLPELIRLARAQAERAG